LSTVTKTDIKYMKQALKLASCGLYTSYPNPAVGCVIVRDGKILGKGYHHKAGQPHAEVMALTDANFDVKGATAYVTLEPCSHYGRTPPCALKLVEMKVKKVVVAADDPNPKVNGKGFKILRDAGIEVVQHVLEKKALFQNRAFMKSITSPYPYISLKVGMSLDAKTAMFDGSSKWITNDKSRLKVQDLRAKSDCIITGCNTVIADNPKMNVRYEEFPKKKLDKIDKMFIRQPLKVILDTHAKLDINKYQIFKEGEVLLCRGTTDKEQYNMVRKLNEFVTEILLPIDEEHIDLHSLLLHLGALKIRRVFVEAGATLLSSFINQGLYDELYAFTAAKFVGGNGKSAFNVNDPVSLDKCQKLKLHKVKTFGTDVLLHYVKE